MKLFWKGGTQCLDGEAQWVEQDRVLPKSGANGARGSLQFVLAGVEDTEGL